MNDDDRPLRAAVRDALAASEPAHTPAFATLWRRAARPRRSRRSSPWRLAAAVAMLAIVTVSVWRLQPARVPAVDPDYLLAARVVADYGRARSTDDWLDQLPAAPLSGGPALPEVEYPLLPKETFL